MPRKSRYIAFLLSQKSFQSKFKFTFFAVVHAVVSSFGASGKKKLVVGQVSDDAYPLM